MRKLPRWRSWKRLFIWSHVIGVVGFYLVLWLRTASRQEGRVEQLPTRVSTTPTTDPLVSIIVPARDEEENIRRCVTSLLDQDYGNYEVIAVDDGSTDATGTILDDLAFTHPHGDRLWTLRLRDLPKGWAGKPHAIHRGVQEASGDWFLFTDADTWHAPNALRSVMKQAMQEKIDLLTLGTEQELPNFWDRVLMPMAYLGISMQYPPYLVNDPASPVAIANGQFILIRRSTYEQVGGYARPELRGALVDDRDLARVVKGSGFTLRFLDGRDLVHVHMYRSFRDTWRGWRKNAYLGSRGGLPFVLLELLGLPCIAILPFLVPFLAWSSRRKSGGLTVFEALLVTFLEVGSVALYRDMLNKELAIPWYYTLTHPLAGAVFEGILVQSAMRILTHKGVDWRGRNYHSNQSQTVSTL
jgi:chlorobactene glucosyltransferase